MGHLQYRQPLALMPSQAHRIEQPDSHCIKVWPVALGLGHEIKIKLLRPQVGLRLFFVAHPRLLSNSEPF